MGYGPRAQVDRAPLPPPVGYASPPSPINRTPANESTGALPADHRGWRASPRWKAVKGDGCIEVEHDLQAHSQLGELRRC